MKHKSKKKPTLKYYPDYSIIEAERQSARADIKKNGYVDGLNKEKAERILDEEYFFLKKLRRVCQQEFVNGLVEEKNSIADDTEFGQIFIQLIDRLAWNKNIQDVLTAGLQMYFADGVTGFESLRRLMMIKGLCLIGETEACNEDYFLQSLRDFYPEEEK